MVDAALRPGTRKCHSRAPDAVQAVATACPVQRVSGAPLILGRYTTLLVMLCVGLVLDATMRKFQRHFLNWAEEAGASRVAKVATPRVIPRSLSLSLSLSLFLSGPPSPPEFSIGPRYARTRWRG